MSILINIILTINVIVCLLLILVTLMQRPKQEGLGAAFGGGMTENLFGAQTTNVLAKATRVLGATFFVLTLLLAALYSHKATAPSSVQAELAKKKAPAPAATATPAASVSPEAPAPSAPAASSASPAASPAPAASATVATPAPSPEAAPAATPAAPPEDK